MCHYSHRPHEEITGVKSSYRGLGSIDFRAAARSVLVVGRLKDDPTIRIIAHDKSSLAPEGKSIAFALDPETGFEWRGYCETSVDELLAGKGSLQSKKSAAGVVTGRACCNGNYFAKGTGTKYIRTDSKNRKAKFWSHLGENRRQMVCENVGGKFKVVRG